MEFYDHLDEILGRADDPRVILAQLLEKKYRRRRRVRPVGRGRTIRKVRKVELTGGEKDGNR